MCKENVPDNKTTYDDFINSFESGNTKKVVCSMRQIGDYDYSDITPIDVENIILGMKPRSIKSITTICYVMKLYAKYIGNDNLYYMTNDIDRNALWSMAKPNATKKFISNALFESVYHDIEMYEEHNAFYQQTLFRCLYEGIYSDDMSVIKNLRASDVEDDVVTLRGDNGIEHKLRISDSLASDLIALGKLDVWERKNRYGSFNMPIEGLYPDSCFKVENRKGSAEYSYRYSYYRILRKIAKDYVGYGLLPLQLYISGIMYRITMKLKDLDISLSDAFADGNKNRIVSNTIASELERCRCDTEVRNFREMVKGHIDVFEIESEQC